MFYTQINVMVLVALFLERINMEEITIVLGAGGFIGGHLVRKKLNEGKIVWAFDIKPFSDWEQSIVHKNLNVCPNQDLSVPNVRLNNVLINYTPTEIYQLAADMGGMGYIGLPENDLTIMANSVGINLNLIKLLTTNKITTKIFYSSSACVYPERNQLDPLNPNCAENTAYPADPDTNYGWEKLFSERLWTAYGDSSDSEVRIARFHNIFGPNGSWNNGKEKAPAAICRKVAESTGCVEIWGPGTQTRSFLYIDECLEAVERLMASDTRIILNIGSEEMISINDLVRMTARISGKEITIKNVDGPVGVAGRNSCNNLIFKTLGWKPSKSLEEGMRLTYNWISSKVNK